MMQPPYNVAFICTGNSARSILAESILRKDGDGRFNTFSAGSRPSGVVHPLAVKVLRRFGYPAVGFRSKQWAEFATPDAPVMDFVITVCDNAAGEVCPVWHGQPVTAHWGIPDPAAVQGDEATRESAFVSAFYQMKTRVTVFAALRIADLTLHTLTTGVREIGTSLHPQSRMMA